jgi:hypothetical protein
MNIYELNLVKDGKIIPTGIKERGTKLSHIEDSFNRYISDKKDTYLITIKHFSND